MTENANNGS